MCGHIHIIVYPVKCVDTVGRWVNVMYHYRVGVKLVRPWFDSDFSLFFWICKILKSTGSASTLKFVFNQQIVVSSTLMGRGPKLNAKNNVNLSTFSWIISLNYPNPNS